MSGHRQFRLKRPRALGVVMLIFIARGELAGQWEFLKVIGVHVRIRE
jgi:hypothetical protein